MPDIKKKPLAALIIAKMKPKMGDEGTTESSAEASSDSDLEIASDDIISAVKSGDSSALASALKSFFTMCQSDDGGGESEEEGY